MLDFIILYTWKVYKTKLKINIFWYTFQVYKIMKSSISSDMNKPCWKLAKACPQSQNCSVLEENNLLVIT